MVSQSSERLQNRRGEQGGTVQSERVASGGVIRSGGEAGGQERGR